MNWDVIISYHAVVRYASRDDDPHYCEHAVRKEMMRLISDAIPTDFRENTILLQKDEWTFVLNSESSIITTAYKH